MFTLFTRLGLKRLHAQQARRSLFGYFCRRCSITYQKMSYSGIVFLLSDYHEWLLGHPTAGYHQVKKDMITYGLLFVPVLQYSSF